MCDSIAFGLTSDDSGNSLAPYGAEMSTFAALTLSPALLTNVFVDADEIAT
jgi:hypothetical protein